jgi:hypothetical protein
MDFELTTFTKIHLNFIYKLLELVSTTTVISSMLSRAKESRIVVNVILTKRNIVSRTTVIIDKVITSMINRTIVIRILVIRTIVIGAVVIGTIVIRTIVH